RRARAPATPTRQPSFPAGPPRLRCPLTRCRRRSRSRTFHPQELWSCALSPWKYWQEFARPGPGSPCTAEDSREQRKPKRLAGFKNRGETPFRQGQTRREAGTQNHGSGDEPDGRVTEEGVRNWRSSAPRRPPCFLLQFVTDLHECFWPRC